jgi:alkylation response protein AidB-like acyl-CoA dehydrogenase
MTSAPSQETPGPQSPHAWPLSADEADLVARAVDFGRRVVALAADGWDVAGNGLPRPVVLEWAALGLNGLQVSAAQGGGGAGFYGKLAVAEALAATCFASAFALNNMQSFVTRMAWEGSPDQVARYLPRLVAGELVCAPSLTEPGAGSDLAAITTRATKVAGGWRLDGEKAWVTNGMIADLLILYAQTEPGAGLRGIASFIVDTHAPGIERVPEALIGGGAIGAARVILRDVHVADADLFAPAGLAFKRGLSGITAARVVVPAMICATVESALRLALGYAEGREAFGRPLSGHQGLRWQLVDVATELEAARLLVRRAAERIETGADPQVDAAFAKKYAAEMAARAIPACMQVMGATGLRREHPFGQHMVAARIAAYVDGTTEIQNERIGVALARRYGVDPAS